MPTDQEKALRTLRNKYGREAFTTDHLNYRQVGVGHGGHIVSTIGDTWDDAIRNLEVKIAGGGV